MYIIENLFIIFVNWLNIKKKNISYLCIYNISKYLLLRFERLGVFIFEIVLLLIVFNVCFVYML